MKRDEEWDCASETGVFASIFPTGNMTPDFSHSLGRERPIRRPTTMSTHIALRQAGIGHGLSVAALTEDFLDPRKRTVTIRSRAGLSAPKRTSAFNCQGRIFCSSGGVIWPGAARAAAPGRLVLLHQLDFTGPPGLVEPCLGRAVEPQEAEPSLIGNRLNPVRLFPLGCLGAEVEVN